MNNHVRCAALVLVALLALSAPAGAQLFRAYVSAAGSDTNPCTLASPCRLLPAAHTAVADGGEIWMLNSANFNTGQVEITKSVTILAIPGAVGSVVATGAGHAININTAGVKVTLRNLVIVHLASSADGVRFSQGASLLVEGCEIANVSGNGIYSVAANATVTVRETVIRNVGAGAVQVAGSFQVLLSRVQITGAGGPGISVGPNSYVTVSRSVVDGNQDGLLIVAGSSGAARVAVEQSVISRNTRYGIWTVPIQPVAINVLLTDSSISGSGTAGAALGSSPGPGTTLTLDRSTIAGPGITGAGTPTVYTRGNNNISSVAGATLTPLAAQ